MKIIASAPGKIIISGEHFVVYGAPAIVMAINLRVKVLSEKREDQLIKISSNYGFSGIFNDDKFIPISGEEKAKEILEPVRTAIDEALKNNTSRKGVNIEIDSEIPLAVGLGSSGALAVSTVASVSKLFNIDLKKDELIKISLEAEKKIHFKPSGIDPTISACGGIILYKNGVYKPLNIERPLPIIIGNTGIQRITGDLIFQFGNRFKKFPRLMNQITRSAGFLTEHVVKALNKGDLNELGELMNINHCLLKAVGVSNEKLDYLVSIAKKGGSLGAKLTGAGGGGCIIALTKPEDRDKVSKEISNAGGFPIIVDKENNGVCTWKI